MLRSGTGALIRLHASLISRPSTYEQVLRPWESSARWMASSAESTPKESHESDSNVTQGPVKEDFIDTPLPGVSEEARSGKKSWPHQGDKELRKDLDIPDEGETISKTPGYKPHTDPEATPDLSGKRSYHVFSAARIALSHRVRGMHSGDLFLAEKHPDDKHGEELKHADKNPDDPQHGFLPGNFDYLPNETEREDVMDPSRLQDPDKQMERRRAKDPEYFDRVHGGNPAQAREAAAEEASSNMHKERRKSGDEIFAGDAAGRPNIGA